MIRQLPREVRLTTVPRNWLGRLLGGVLGFALTVIAFLFFTALLIAAGILGIVLLLYILHAQRKAQQTPSDVVIDGEYSVESSEHKPDGRATQGFPKSREDLR